MSRQGKGTADQPLCNWFSFSVVFSPLYRSSFSLYFPCLLKLSPPLLNPLSPSLLILPIPFSLLISSPPLCSILNPLCSFPIPFLGKGNNITLLIL